jgi:hypothetical protein
MWSEVTYSVAFLRVSSATRPETIVRIKGKEKTLRRRGETYQFSSPASQTCLIPSQHTSDIAHVHIPVRAPIRISGTLPMPIPMPLPLRPVARMVLLRRRHGGLDVYHVDVRHGP